MIGIWDINEAPENMCTSERGGPVPQLRGRCFAVVGAAPFPNWGGGGALHI